MLSLISFEHDAYGLIKKKKPSLDVIIIIIAIEYALAPIELAAMCVC